MDEGGNHAGLVVLQSSLIGRTLFLGCREAGAELVDSTDREIRPSSISSLRLDSQTAIRGDDYHETKYQRSQETYNVLVRRAEEGHANSTIAIVPAHHWTESPHDLLEIAECNRSPVTPPTSPPKEESSTRRWAWPHLVWTLCLIIALLAATALGGICGSGHCRTRSEPQTKPKASLEPTTTNASLADSSNATVAFTSTQELYRAVDEYLAAGGGGQDALESARHAHVSIRYGYPIGRWNVSLITDFSRVFDPDRNVDLLQERSVSRNRSTFNEDLSGWDVSSATTMVGTFAFAEEFNGNVSTWKTFNVANMSYMFFHAIRFNGDLTAWDTSRVHNTRAMFWSASSFSGDLSLWNVSSVELMQGMFFKTPLFESALSDWDTSNVKSMESTFAYSTSFSSDISGWRVSKVMSMSSLFSNAYAFNGNLSLWDVGRVKDMTSMFENAVSFEGEGISTWDVGRVETMKSMFLGCSRFNGDLSSWNTSNVENMSSMFLFCPAFTSDLSKWNVGKVTTMFTMFTGASSFNSDLSHWNVSMVEDMSLMFCNATSFSSDVSRWDVSRVRDMTALFFSAHSFTSDLSWWSVENVEMIHTIFFMPVGSIATFQCGTQAK
jgi:surface protein